MDIAAAMTGLDLAAAAVFAATGALVASRKEMDLLGFLWLGVVTGIGGGTLRDLLLGLPVFWVRDPAVAPVCFAVALVAWFTPHRWWEGRALEWADAAGLGAYAVLGTVKALAYGVSPVPAMMMGVITGCVGGIIRDVLAGRPSILMRPELYVTAAALASGLCALGRIAGLPDGLVWPVAALAGFGLRGAAIHWKLGIPAYGSRR